MKKEETDNLTLDDMRGIAGGNLTEAQKDVLLSTAIHAKQENWDWDMINESLGRWNLVNEEASNYIKMIWEHM